MRAGWEEVGVGEVVTLNYGKGNYYAAIPAVVFKGDRNRAMLEALKANSRDTLPLTKNERTDAAWRLVRASGKSLSVPTVAKAAGVGAATVDRMRKRWVIMQLARAVPNGAWWRDRQDVLPEMDDRPEMADGQRKAAVEALAERIREAMGKMPWQDQNIATEALQRALGTYKLRTMINWLYDEDAIADEFINEFKDDGDTDVVIPEEAPIGTGSAPF